MTKQIVRIQNVRPKKTRLKVQRKIYGINSRIDDVRFKGERFRATVTDAIVAAEISRTIDGASILTMTVEDDQRELINSRVLSAKFDVEIDGLWFRYVGLDDEGRTAMNLRFEARDVNRLRQKKGHVKALRNKVTRAEFALLLIRELRNPAVPFFSPELHVTQPIRNSREARREKTEKTTRREPGLNPNASIQVKKTAASKTQKKNIDRVLDVGVSLRAPRKVLVAAVACITQESNAYNIGYGDAAGPDSRGLFQQRPSTGWPGDPNNIENAARNFFKNAPTYPGGAIAYNRKNPKADLPTLINAIQISFDKTLYRQWTGEAQDTVSEYLGNSKTSTTIETEKTIPYAFERKKDESSWAALQRLADEVKWRCFESNGLIYFTSDDYLLSSRVRMYVSDGRKGINTISTNYAGNRKVEEVRITGRSREWAAPPGSVVQIKGRGPANGRYLVTDVRSSLFSDDFEATIQRPKKPLPEPPPETKTITRKYPGHREREAGGGDREGGDSTAGALSKVRIGQASSGSPWWGGSWPVFKQFVIPFMADRGLKSWTGKRGYNTGSGVSDHYTGSVNAFAADFGTYSGEGAARALAAAMGYRSWSPDSYATFNARVDGRTFQVQILWGSGIAHGDHVHVGMHRI